MARSLDDYFPPRGPCGLCGCADARHRLFDAFRGQRKAGATVEEIAADFREPVEAVQIVLDLPRSALRKMTRRADASSR